MNDSNEIQINFKDYLIYTVRRWKSILVVALLLTLLLGAFGAYKGVKAFNEKRDAFHEKVEQYDADYAEYENLKTAFTLELVNMKERFDKQEEYNNNSLLIQLDPDKVLETTADLLLVYDPESEIDVTDKPFINSILKITYNSLYEDADWDDIGNFINLDAEYAKELVRVYVDYNSYTVTIVVLYPDKGYADAIIDKLLTGAKNKLKNMDVYEGYDLKVYSQSSETIRDDSVAQAIENSKNSYDSLKETYESGIANTEGLVEPEYPDNSDVTRKTIAVKAVIFGAIGFALGVLLMFVFYYNKFIRKGIVYSAGEFKRITEVENLGVFPDSRIKGKKNSEISDETAYERIKIYIDNYDGLKNILLIGNSTDDKVKEIYERLGKMYSDKKFSLYDSFENNAALQFLLESDGVIFVVKREKTMLSTLIGNKLFVEKNDKKMLGNIVL